MQLSSEVTNMLWRSSSIEQWKGGNEGGEHDDALFEYLEDLSENDLNQLRGVVDLSDVLPLKPDPILAYNPPGIQPKQEPAFIDQPSHLPAAGLPEMKLTLFHKPRGSGGLWKPVAEGDAIRVTKDKGKKLRLRIECNFDFEWGELDLSLVDLVSYTDSRQDFTVDFSKSSIKPTFAEIELNLIRICKKLQFAVVLKSKHGWTCNGRTITFIAHNNGKERTLKIEPNSSHEPSPSTSPMPSPGTVTTPPQQIWPSLNAAPIEQLQNQAGKKRKVESENADEPRAEAITTIPGPLNVQGVVRATGFIQYSDLRLKTNVQDLVDALRLVQDLQGKTYHWKGTSNSDDASSSGKRVIGFIAQEVQRVVPEVVHEDPATGLLSVSYAELVPVLVEALKQHLAAYTKDKEEFRKEIDELKEKMLSLALVKSENREDKSDEDWDSIIERIKTRTNNFEQAMTMEEVALVSKWAAQCDIKLEFAIRKNIRMAKKLEKQRKREERLGQKEHLTTHHRRGKFNRNKSSDEMELQQTRKFEQTLMLDPMKTQSAVLRFGARMFKMASKRNSKLIAVVFWRKGYIQDLHLHLHREEGALPKFGVAKENKHQRRKITGVVGKDNDSYHGTYKVLVQIEGSGSTYHLQQSKAVVAVFDFRLAGSLPLWMMASSACGSGGKNWVVGSFVVDKSVLQWQTMPNTVLNNLPPDWASCTEEGLSLSDPLPLRQKLGGQEIGEPAPQRSPAQDHLKTGGKGAPPAPRRVFLRSYHGAYLSATPEGKVYCSLPRIEDSDGPAVPHFAETWDMEFDRHGAAFLRSFYGRYLSASVLSPTSISLTASKEFPGTEGRETFLPLLDDRLHTLGLISFDGHYLYANAEASIACAPTLPSLSIPPTKGDSFTASVSDSHGDSSLKSSIEFYKLMSEGCRAYLEQNTEDSGRDVLSSSFEFYQHLGRGGSLSSKTLLAEQEEEKVDMKGTFEFFKHLSDGATKSLEQTDSTSVKATVNTKAHATTLMDFHLPTEEEKWFIEVAPSREAQQAQLAQEVWEKTKQLRMIYSLHAAQVGNISK